MRRRVLATISFLSLLLFVTTCVLVAFSWKTRLWLQGDWRGAETIRDGELPLTQAVELGFERGCVQVRYQATRGVGSVDPTTHRVGPVDREPLSLSLHAEARDPPAPALPLSGVGISPRCTALMSVAALTAVPASAMVRLGCCWRSFLFFQLGGGSGRCGVDRRNNSRSARTARTISPATPAACARSAAPPSPKPHGLLEPWFVRVTCGEWPARVRWCVGIAS